MSSLWVDKYKPKKIADIVGNKDKIKKNKRLVECFYYWKFNRRF